MKLSFLFKKFISNNDEKIYVPLHFSLKTKVIYQKKTVKPCLTLKVSPTYFFASHKNYFFKLNLQIQRNIFTLVKPGTKHRITWKEAFHLLKRVALRKYRIKHFAELAQEYNFQNKVHEQVISFNKNTIKKRMEPQMVKNEKLSIDYQELQPTDKLAESIISSIVDELKDRSTISRGLSSLSSLSRETSISSDENKTKIITFPIPKDSDVKITNTPAFELPLYPTGKRIILNGPGVDQSKLSNQKFKPRPSLKQIKQANPLKVAPNKKPTLSNKTKTSYVQNLAQNPTIHSPKNREINNMVTAETIIQIPISYEKESSISSPKSKTEIEESNDSIKNSNTSFELEDVEIPFETVIKIDLTDKQDTFSLSDSTNRTLISKPKEIQSTKSLRKSDNSDNTSNPFASVTDIEFSDKQDSFDLSDLSSGRQMNTSSDGTLISLRKSLRKEEPNSFNEKQDLIPGDKKPIAEVINDSVTGNTSCDETFTLSATNDDKVVDNFFQASSPLISKPVDTNQNSQVETPDDKEPQQINDSDNFNQKTSSSKGICSPILFAISNYVESKLSREDSNETRKSLKK